VTCDTTDAGRDVTRTLGGCDLAVFVLLVSGLLVPCQTSLLDSVRFASKKAGGSCKNTGGKSPGRRYGSKKYDGSNASFLPHFLFVLWVFSLHVTAGYYHLLFFKLQENDANIRPN